MKESMVIMELVLKQQLLAKRLAGHQGRPLSIGLTEATEDLARQCEDAARHGKARRGEARYGMVT